MRSYFDLQDFFYFIYLYIMKLFIKNKKYFEDTFLELWFDSLKKGDYFSPQKIHHLAYNELFNSVNDGNIPIGIAVSIGNRSESIAIFNFVNLMKNDVYVYEYTGTAG